MDDDVIVFHSGTKLMKNADSLMTHSKPMESEADSMVVTDGGRVLGVTALGSTHEEAREKAYRNASRIFFEGAQFRKDIGLLNRK